MLPFLRNLLEVYFFFVLIYFLCIDFVYTLFLAVSWKQILTYKRRSSFSDLQPLIQSDLTYPVSIIVPAYNESKTIAESVSSLLKLKYGKYEVIVVNDGSKDKTLEQLINHFNLKRIKKYYYPFISTKEIRGIYKSQNPAYFNLLVLDKENGGKSDALNAGINISQYDHICCIDADSILEDDSLLKAMKPFHEDSTIVAVGGIVRIVNGCKITSGRVVKVGLPAKVLPIFQIVEYLRAFLSGRMFWNIFQGSLIVSGAFGILKKQMVIEIGGYSTDTVGEDMELVTRIHRVMLERKESYKIVFVPEPVCWTEVPDTIKGLARQRNRWHRGLLETLLRHIKMLLNPKYKMVGMGAMPYFFFIEFLGPIVEGFGYIMIIITFLLGILDLNFALIFLFVSIIYGTMFSVGAVLLEELSFRRYPNVKDVALLLSFGVIENFIYRQLTVLWRIKGTIDYFIGKRHWEKVERKGFTS